MPPADAPGAERESRAKPAPAARRQSFVALAKQSLVYGVSGVALQAVGVITLPVFSRTFSPAEYGLVELGLVSSAVVLAVVDAGMASAAQRSYYDYTDAQREARRRVLFSALLFTAALAGLALLGALLARELLAAWLFEDGGQTELVVAAALTVPAVTIGNFLRETMRLRFRAWHYVASSTLGAFGAAATGIGAVVWLDYGVEGVFYGLLVGNLLAVLYGAVTVHSDIGSRLSAAELGKMMRFGLPLVPAGLAMWALTLLDRIMLGKLGSLSEVGEYAVANRIGAVLMLGVSGFVLALGPYLFSLYSEDPQHEREVRARTLTYVNVVLCLSALVLALFARELLALVAPDFDRAYKAAGAVLFGVVFLGISSIVMAGISLARRTVYFPLLASLAAVVNVVLNVALIPPFGMVGAAVAATLSFALLALTHYLVAQRVYPTGYEPGKVIVTVLLAAALAALGAVPLEPTALGLPVKLLAVAVFLGALRPAGVLSAGELVEIRSLAAGALRFRPALRRS